MSKNYTLSCKGADKHLLYQWSVQDGDDEVAFSVEQYEKRRGRPPKILREDFCGTALAASCWADGVHVHDFQATILHCLGIDHEKLTFRFQGRDQRLTDIGGQVVTKLLS